MTDTANSGSLTTSAADPENSYKETVPATLTAPESQGTSQPAEQGHRDTIRVVTSSSAVVKVAYDVTEASRRATLRRISERFSR